MQIKLKFSKRLITIVASYCIGLSIVISLLYYIGFDKLLGNIVDRLSYQIFLITLLLNILGLIIYAIIWHILLISTGSNIRFKTSLMSTWASIFTIYVSPTGFVLEILKIVLANREGKVPIGSGIAALTMQRIIYSISFTAIAVTSYMIAQYRYMIIGEMLGRVILALLAIASATIITLIVLGQKADKLESIILKIYNRYQNNINKMILKYNVNEIVNSVSSIVDDFKNSFETLKSKRYHLTIVFALTVFNWFLNVMILYLVLLSLGYVTSIWILMVIMVACEFVQMTPIAIPGMLGILETVMTIALQMFGIPLDIAITASILTRLATFWCDLPITATAASYYGVKYLISGLKKTTYN